MSKQHCRMLQVERFFHQNRMLLRHCCRFWQQCRTSCFDVVERTKFHENLVRQSTLLPKPATKSNAASTLLLVCKGLKQGRWTAHLLTYKECHLYDILKIFNFCPVRSVLWHCWWVTRRAGQLACEKLRQLAAKVLRQKSWRQRINGHLQAIHRSPSPGQWHSNGMCYCCDVTNVKSTLTKSRIAVLSPLTATNGFVWYWTPSSTWFLGLMWVSPQTASWSVQPL